MLSPVFHHKCPLIFTANTLHFFWREICDSTTSQSELYKTSQSPFAQDRGTVHQAQREAHQGRTKKSKRKSWHSPLRVRDPCSTRRKHSMQISYSPLFSVLLPTLSSLLRPSCVAFSSKLYVSAFPSSINSRSQLLMTFLHA